MHLSTTEAIEVWDQLRTHVLNRSHKAAAALQELAQRDWAALTPRDRAVILIASALERDPMVPTARRAARRILSTLEDESAQAVAEENPFLVREEEQPWEALPEKRRALLRSDVRRVMDDSFWAALKAAAGPSAAMRLVEKQLPSLSGNRTPRFLRALGYPAVHPDKARRRWLHRFGLLEKDGETAAVRTAAIAAFGEFAEGAGAPLGELDIVIGVFTGAEGSDDPEAAFCLPTPRCETCPIARQCQYARVMEKFGVRTPQQPAQGRRLADAFLPEDLPREKLQRLGPDALTDAELLAILLRTGSGKDHAVELANKVLKRAGTLDRLSRYSIAELTALPGIGTVKAVTMKAALEIARRVAANPITADEQVTSARRVFEQFRGYFLDRQKEYFLCLLLNTKNRIIRQVTISEGTLNQSLVHPREAFQEAIRDSAHAVIFLHNHPSGDPTPSREDRHITRRLVQAGEIVGVRVLDHIIIGKTSFYSFADEGQMTD